MLGMRKPKTAFLSDSLHQSLKHLGSIRKAAAEVSTPYSTAWRILKKQKQPHVSKQRRISSLSAQDDKAAYDLLGKHTAACAAAQLYTDDTVPNLLHKTAVIRADKRHAALLETDLTYLKAPPRKELRSATKTKTGLRQGQPADKLEAGAVH